MIIIIVPLPVNSNSAPTLMQSPLIRFKAAKNPQTLTIVNAVADSNPPLGRVLFMLAVLSVLQVVVSIIDVIQFIEARWIELQ